MKHSRIIAMIMALVMVFALTACGGETTPDATVNENPTELTTEAPTSIPADVCADMGHAWVDATCDAAKTCSVCGETEGEALGHAWIDATYEAPKTCETCGATEGEALVAYFAEHGLIEKLRDKTAEHEFVQTCGSDTEKTTTLKVTVENYQTIASDETHEAMDGYEWKVMAIKMRLHDENAQKFGINTWNYMWDDFYIGKASDANENTDGLFENGMVYPINWNGVDYADGSLRIAETAGAWEKDENGNQYLDIVITVSVRVPVGYDGFIFGMEGYGWEIADGAFLHEAITDNTMLFRMD